VNVAISTKQISAKTLMKSNSNSVAKPLMKDGKPGTPKAQKTQVAHRWETAKLYKNCKGKKLYLQVNIQTILE